MATGDHRIDPQEIRTTASTIRKMVSDLESSKKTLDKAATDLTGAGAGGWSTPKASKKFDTQWNEWSDGLRKLLEVGPDFAKWLDNYASDAENFDQHYS
ncbi:WXG100 family type VII secretion target [Nocardioides jishulii]|uniref:WXG100 family type VII secretion target n=1 Tax=Nocardioides jishulii TaxID=2575440 RepID=A0A4U2YTJ7_9ACTN|nr:WXG100 family type VII secretion target [Nocardioides jishulii]QCX28300.1 WXG100 family type VII secretion target [Nocardioides jishulii]TKI64807.1 WXG100 family type VII secretion target [Nocardioides jishulii]